MKSENKEKRLKVVIVGGGFAGVFAARELAKCCPAGTDIELINDKNYFVFQPLLPEVASGIINAQDAVSSLRTLLGGVHFHYGQVKEVDFKKKQVLLLQGQKRRVIAVDYDEIVLACGLEPSLNFAPGLTEHSLTMKNLADAYSLRNHIIQCLEWADVTKNQELKREILTFVVAGGGFSGVETIGEVHDMLLRALPYFPNVKRSEIQCHIVQRGDHLLPELPTSLGEYTAKVFAKRGINILLNTGVSEASKCWVSIRDLQGNETVIRTRTLVTTIGNGPTDLVQTFDHLERGRIVVDEYLRVTGRDHTWALGDNALVPVKTLKDADADNTRPIYAPPTAQFATAQAKTLARNLTASVTSEDKNQASLKPFEYKSKGAMASLGSYDAVAEVMGLRLRGIIAWFVWRSFYIMLLPGFVSKVRVTLNWMFDYFFPRSIVSLAGQSADSPIRREHYRKGDVLFRPGEVLDGLYFVTSGKLEVAIPTNGDGDSDNKMWRRVVMPQDHLGDRIRGYNTKVLGTVSALEDTDVTVLDWSELIAISGEVTAVGEHLHEQSKVKYPKEIYGDLGSNPAFESQSAPPTTQMTSVEASDADSKPASTIESKSTQNTTTTPSSEESTKG